MLKSFSKPDRQPHYIIRTTVLTFLALLYGVLTQKYRAYDIDNPWFLSFSYNVCHSGIQIDEFEQLRFPAGMDGVHLFGKIAAGVQCLVMNRFGWSPTTVVGLNVAFGIASFCLLWSFLYRLGYRERWIAAFILVLGMTEPIVSMMEKARYEFFAFFLLSLALWLGVMEVELLSSFIAFCAVETEPAAIMIPIAVLLFLSSRTKNRPICAMKSGVAAIVALLIYVTLHPTAIQNMVTSSVLGEHFPLGGTFRAYFLDRRRHWPEAGVLLLGVGLIWRQGSELAYRMPIWIALVMISTLFLLHPTAAYVVFAMPFLLWPTLEAYDRSTPGRWVVAILLAYLSAGYTYLYVANMHEGFEKEEFHLIREKIDEAADRLLISSDQLRIVGDYSVWFAHPRHYVALTTPTTLERADIYLCFDGPLEQAGLSASNSTWCAAGQRMAPMREISSVEVKRHLLHIYALVR